MKKDEKYKKLFVESGYGALIAPKEPEVEAGEPKTCHTCNEHPRHLLKSGKYDAYCPKCRSEINKKYGTARRQRMNRFKARYDRRYMVR
tara:strand:- start:292 stop:558 length:267 start_codon:yes stop_codon:yes gene_type:complete